MAMGKMEESSLQTWIGSRALDRTGLISVVAVKLVQTSQSQDQTGAPMGTRSLGVRAKGIRSLRYQMTKKCKIRDIKMCGETESIKTSSSLGAWWFLWIKFSFTCNDGEEVLQINYQPQSQMVTSRYGRVRGLPSVLCSNHQDHPSQATLVYEISAALQAFRSSFCSLAVPAWLSIECFLRQLFLIWVTYLRT